jgi:hypothetical protein
MAFTDHCDVFGSFHEDGFNRIVDHVRFQRPSMFNYATQAIADNPALLCQPIVAHPRLNAHGNPLVTIIDPLDLPGSNFALNFSVQLVDVKIDFHPPNVVTLPPELAPLPVQRLSIGLRVCAGIGCPPAAVVESLIPLPPDPDADPHQPPPPPPPKVVLPTDQQLICVCLDAFVVGGLRFKQYFQHFFLEPFVDRIEIQDIQPASLESGLECVIDATLRLGFLPKLRFLLDTMTLNLVNDVKLSLSVLPKPVPTSPQVPNNPALEQNEVRAFIDVEVS